MQLQKAQRSKAKIKLGLQGLYIVKESGQFSCRGFRCLNVGFFLLKIVVFVFSGTVV